MAEPHNELNYASLGCSHVVYGVTVNANVLPPITLATLGRGFNLHDYFTPDEADKLADALKRAAARVRAGTEVVA